MDTTCFQMLNGVNVLQHALVGNEPRNHQKGENFVALIPCRFEMLQVDARAGYDIGNLPGNQFLVYKKLQVVRILKKYLRRKAEADAVKEHGNGGNQVILQENCTKATYIVNGWNSK